MSDISRRSFLGLVALVLGLLTLSTNPAEAVSRRITGAIAGIVTNSHGHPAANVPVTLETAQHHVVAATHTNEHGAFHFPHVIPGHYTVGATGHHNTHGAAAVVVHAGHTATVHVVLH